MLELFTSRLQWEDHTESSDDCTPHLNPYIRYDKRLLYHYGKKYSLTLTTTNKDRLFFELSQNGFCWALEFMRWELLLHRL